MFTYLYPGKEDDKLKEAECLSFHMKFHNSLKVNGKQCEGHVPVIFQPYCNSAFHKRSKPVDSTSQMSVGVMKFPNEVTVSAYLLKW